MEIEDIYRKEALFILNNFLKVNIHVEDIIKVKKIFKKKYSKKTIKKVQFLINVKLHCLLKFISSDSFDYIDEQKDTFLNIDNINLYALKTKKYKYHLLHSVVYDKDELRLKTEKVELFVKT